MQTLRDLLENRIAPSRQYSERTIELYTITLDKFAAFLGHEPTLDDLDDVTAAKFCRWRLTTQFRGKQITPATVGKDSTQLKSMWNFAAKKRLKRSDGTDIEFPDFKTPTIPKPRPRAFHADDLAKLVETARHRRGYVGRLPAAWYWSTKLMAQFQTGERIGAILELRWGEVDLDQKTLTFLAHTRKGHSQTITRPITERLASLLACEKGPDSERVWPWLEHRSYPSLYASLKVLCRTAGVPYKPFHSIRKATASYLRRGGVSAKGQLGHETDGVAERHYYDEDIVGRENNLDLLPDIE